MIGERLGETARLGQRTGRSFAVLVSALAGLTMACISISCSPSSSASSASAAGTSCRTTGGTCVLGGATCAKQAPSGAQDCNPPPVNPGGAFCCLELQEGGGITSANDGGPDAYSGPCMISASSYDQTCMVDTDCTEVTSTNYCTGHCLCGGSAINVGALAKFNEDISTTPLGSGSAGDGCPCISLPGPCCRGGKCTAACFWPTDTLPACSDAGGTCALSAGTTCGKAGPPDACAYSDETCCVN